MHRHTRRFVAVVLIGMLAAGVGALTAGRISYLTTSGTSMEPTFSAGDLVVVVPQDSYEIGDAVAYPDPGSGGTVLHRIIDGDGKSGFRLQGDNNRSVDPHEPIAADMTGRAVFHIPRIGSALSSPITKGVLFVSVAGLIGSLIMAPRAITTTHAPNDRRRRGVHRPRSRGRTIWMAFVGLDVILILAVAVAFMVRPATDAAPEEDAAVEQDLELSYAADVADTETYPDGRLQTGDTVFRSLIDTIDVVASTSGDGSNDSGDISGEARLDVTVTSSAGWSRTIPLVEQKRFDDEVDLAAALSLSRFENLADRIAAETGVSAGSIDLSVHFIGTAGLDDEDTVDFAVALPFRLTGQTLTYTGEEPTATDTGSLLASSIELPAAAPATTTETGAIPEDLTRVALVALLLAVGITAVIWPTTGQEHDAVVRVRSADLHHPTATTSIEIGDLADLERIARQANVPILRRDNGWEGLVSHGILYWTAPEPTPQTNSGPPPTPATPSEILDGWELLPSGEGS